MRYQIDRTLDCNWQLLSKVLYDLQYETRHILNKTIQLCWEYSGFASDYKEIHGVSPKKKERQDILGYTDLHGFSYNILKEKHNKFYSGNLSQTVKRAADRWNNDLKYILKGEMSIPNFKKDSPIDIVKEAIRIHKDDREYCMDLKLIGSNYVKELQRKSTSFCVKVMV